MIWEISRMICDQAHKLTVRSLGPWPEEALRNGYPLAGIKITTTPAGFGGARTWFLCPACARRCCILYYHPVRAWACRVCCNGRYASETEGPVKRLYRKARKLRRRLGQTDGNMFLPFPGKPDGMHWSTYLTLRKEGLAIEKCILDYKRRNLPSPAECRSLEISLSMQAEGENDQVAVTMRLPVSR
jgi:hypothetical protein